MTHIQGVVFLLILVWKSKIIVSEIKKKCEHEGLPIVLEMVKYGKQMFCGYGSEKVKITAFWRYLSKPAE